MLLFLQLLWLPLAPVLSTSVWSWSCLKDAEGGRCVREKVSVNSLPVSLATCILTCDDAAALFPKPQKVKLGKEVVYFDPSHIHHTPTKCFDNVCTLLNEAFSLMIETIHKYHPKFDHKNSDHLWRSQTNKVFNSQKLLIQFEVDGIEEYLTLSTNESYSLKISTTGQDTSIVIIAPTFFGARHGLETLSQLIDYDKEKNALQMISYALIEDYPAFPYRGILLDTSRNYYPIKALKRVIDGMSFNKLNYFHWHISDSASFPLLMSSLPKMGVYGPYSPEEVYTSEDVTDLVQYAKLRGIRIIPEIDAPSHVGFGWEWGEEEGLGNLVVCLGKQPWDKYCAGPPCGQMNLANNNLYLVLGKIYREVINMFSPLELFHYGGDEVNIECWNSTSEVLNWMIKNDFGVDEEAYLKQWSIFQERARRLLTDSNKGKEVQGIVWTSTLTEKSKINEYLDPDKYIIQIWSKGTNPAIGEILKKGYKVIISNWDKLYLDCGSSSWVSDGNNWCSPYKGWQEIYDNDILKLARNHTGSSNFDKQVLGGEATVWSEQIDEQTLDAKLWPRASALSERLWTNPQIGNFSLAENRIVQHRHRLVQRGLGAERLKPEFCRQNEGECRKPWSPKIEEDRREAEALQILTTIGSFSSSNSISIQETKFRLLCLILFNSLTFLFFC
ncbi:UNVERIFIED_CONTAM: hypothetical protein RMT77_001468 [Armadillidium vulgare]